MFGGQKFKIDGDNKMNIYWCVKLQKIEYGTEVTMYSVNAETKPKDITNNHESIFHFDTWEEANQYTINLQLTSSTQF